MANYETRVFHVFSIASGIIVTIAVVSVVVEIRRPKSEDIRPMKIAETNDVVLWKVQDTTPGGDSFVYFTTPSEH